MNQFTIRPFQEKDFVIIQNWFQKRNFPCPEKSLLPQTGVVIEHEGESIAAGFIYKTDTPIAMISHLCSNPDTEKNIRRLAVDTLIDDMANIAKIMGFSIATFGTNIKNLEDRVKDIGFEQTDLNVNHYRRILCH